jgi:hypothetical protein
VSSQNKKVKVKADGSVDAYFGRQKLQLALKKLGADDSRQWLVYDPSLWPVRTMVQ